MSWLCVFFRSLENLVNKNAGKEAIMLTWRLKSIPKPENFRGKYWQFWWYIVRNYSFLIGFLRIPTGIFPELHGEQRAPRFGRRRRAWPWKPPKPWPPPWHLAPHPWAPHRYPAGSRHLWRLPLWEHRSLGWTLKGKLAGGFNFFLIFTPKIIWGRNSPILTCAYFSDGARWKTTN